MVFAKKRITKFLSDIMSDKLNLSHIMGMH